MNNQYWEARALIRQSTYDKSADAVVKTVRDAYTAAAKQMRTDARAILGGFGRAFKLTSAEARAILGEKVPPRVEARLRDAWVALPENVRKAIGESSAYRARLDRLEALRLSAKTNIGRVAGVQSDCMDKELLSLANDAYSRTMFDVQRAEGFLFPSSGMSVGRVADILKENWSGITLSARVWKNAKEVSELAGRALIECAMMGKTSTQTFESLCRITDDSAFAANRLIRTEWSNIANRAEIAAYKDAKIKKYRFLAVLDMRTSEICQRMDGRTFDLDKAKTGVNLPPLHPYCRSTTEPILDGEAIGNGKRLARDPLTNETYKVPENMTYAEWLKAQEEKYGADALSMQKEKIRNARKDNANRIAYTDVLGRSRVPKTLDEFQALKYGTPTEYKQLVQDYKATLKERQQRIDRK